MTFVIDFIIVDYEGVSDDAKVVIKGTVRVTRSEWIGFKVHILVEIRHLKIRQVNSKPLQGVNILQPQIDIDYGLKV